ncbi:MAG: hypothetical protein WC438_01820 [Candidatus Pacearchaeota archaeon]
MEITKEQKGFNREIFAGLVGGLFVYWAQISSEFVASNFNNVGGLIFRLFFSLIIALFCWIIFVVTLSKVWK